MSEPAAVEVIDVSKRFGTTHVLRSVSLPVAAGTIVSLLGPSGCGKTTLLRTIAGLERPEAGEVRVDGRVLTSSTTWVPPERRRIGMVFQDWALFPHLTVAANVGYGLPRRAPAADVDAVLAMVGLDGLGDRMPSTLSGGQQQRVALARALAPRPAVLLLDEPFSNLDTALRVQVRAEVHQLLTRLGVTAVFVTHDQAEAFVLGDEVAVMAGGAIVQQAAPAVLYERPATPWVAQFVGDANLIEGRGEGRRAATVCGPVPLLDEAHGVVTVLARPEELVVADVDAGTVELVEYYGHDTVYAVDLDAGPSVRARAGSAPRWRRGDRVTVAHSGRPAVAWPADAAGSADTLAGSASTASRGDTTVSGSPDAPTPVP